MIIRPSLVDRVGGSVFTAPLQSRLDSKVSRQKDQRYFCVAAIFVSQSREQQRNNTISSIQLVFSLFTITLHHEVSTQWTAFRKSFDNRCRFDVSRSSRSRCLFLVSQNFENRNGRGLLPLHHVPLSRFCTTILCSYWLRLG
jgi:hypothetical protein